MSFSVWAGGGGESKRQHGRAPARAPRPAFWHIWTLVSPLEPDLRRARDRLDRARSQLGVRARIGLGGGCARAGHGRGRLAPFRCGCALGGSPATVCMTTDRASSTISGSGRIGESVDGSESATSANGWRSLAVRLPPGDSQGSLCPAGDERARDASGQTVRRDRALDRRIARPGAWSGGNELHLSCASERSPSRVRVGMSELARSPAIPSSRCTR